MKPIDQMTLPELAIYVESNLISMWGAYSFEFEVANRLRQLHETHTKREAELLEALKDLIYDLDTVDSHCLNETVRPIWEDIERAKAIITPPEGA